jgi:hypothetical protein
MPVPFTMTIDEKIAYNGLVVAGAVIEKNRLNAHLAKAWGET